MGLRDEIQTDIAEAFDTDLSDAVGSFLLIETVQGGYDPVTGTTTTTERRYTGRGVFSGYTQDEVDGQHILLTDMKVTVLQSEFVDENQIPASPVVGSTLINETGINNWFRYFFNTYDDYRVISRKKDPAGVTWTIQLRKA